MKFECLFEDKKIVFDSEINGLIVDEKEYLAGQDGILIYDKAKDLRSDFVICQLSTNTSTLIPALKTLDIPYNTYFDRRDVVESQNDITFYWKASRLAAFYNRYSTDGVEIDKREPIIRSAIEFIVSTANADEDFLPEERLKGLDEKCRLLGFYEGFPIFDANFGLPQLKSRLGIHIGTESIMISTPMDKYADDVSALAKKIEEISRKKGNFKKNRVRFEKDDGILDLLLK